MAGMKKRVSFVATGEELINGDILETNTTYFAHTLIENNIQTGQRVIVGDDQEEIEQAIRYLLPGHEALITIGGLGPTLDDRTRYAVSTALNCRLVFNEQTWKWIIDRLTEKGFPIPDTNRQQALLPEGANPIHNTNGTAAACYFQNRGKDIFMLPGPSKECFPIFQNVILSKLQENSYTYKIYRKFWLLIKANEGLLASQLEKLMANSECNLGYCIRPPYLEIKLWSENQEALEALSRRFLPILKPYLAD
ncbi:MAG: competence/damage-inducible protein A [Coxiella endosymbiont of Haemaphysalis qinghaiensis]